MKPFRRYSTEVLIVCILVVIDATIAFSGFEQLLKLLFTYSIWIVLLLVSTQYLIKHCVASSALERNSPTQQEGQYRSIRHRLRSIILIPVFLIELVSLTAFDHTVLGFASTRIISPYRPTPITIECKDTEMSDGIYPGRIGYFDSSGAYLPALTFDSEAYAWINIRDNELKAIEIPFWSVFCEVDIPECSKFWQQMQRISYVRVLDCPRFDSIPVSEEGFIGSYGHNVAEPHTFYVANGFIGRFRAYSNKHNY